MKKRNVLPILLAIFLFFAILHIYSEYGNYKGLAGNGGLTGNVAKDFERDVKFYFYDEKTNCPLGGYVFAGDKLVGKSLSGYFNLSHEKYISDFENKGNISIFGRLGDCFKSNMLFDEYWENPKIGGAYFLQESTFNFRADINYNSPNDRELTGFIRPKEVSSELKNINTNGEILDALSRINNYFSKRIKYVEEEDNYWQIPSQTISLWQGDCEDYSTALLSLFLAYNSSLDCYNIVFNSHVTTFCKIDNYYVYYDQNKIELKKEITYRTSNERAGALKDLNKEYFKYYGIPENEQALYAFNNNEIIRFGNNEDYANWQSTLKKKQGESLLEKMEYEYQQIKASELGKQEGEAEKTNTPQIELGAQKPSLSSLSEAKPSLAGFVKKYIILIISLAVFLLTLMLLILLDRFKLLE